MSYGEVRGDTEPEGRLPHARPRGDDDQVSGLETRCKPVDVAKAGRYAGHVGAGLVQGRDALEALAEQLLDVGEIARHALLREIEDDLLGSVHQLGRLADTVPAELRNLAPGADQPAQRRRLADDACVVRGIGRCRDERRELVKAGAPSDLLELPALLELVDDRDRVDRLPLA